MTDNPRIGKDVIESLTLGMYEDCRFIYREYIQNSADQVDKAVAEKLINAGEDEIHISNRFSLLWVTMQRNISNRT